MLRESRVSAERQGDCLCLRVEAGNLVSPSSSFSAARHLQLSVIVSNYTDMCPGLTLAGNYVPQGCSLTPPSPIGMRRGIRKECKS